MTNTKSVSVLWSVLLLVVQSEQQKAIDTVGQYGFIVSLGRLKFDHKHRVYEWTHKCAGSLIRSKYPAQVLTAAHCVHWPGFSDDGHTIGDVGYKDYYIAFNKEMEWIHPEKSIIGRVKRVDLPRLFKKKRRKTDLFGDLAVITVDLSAPKDIMVARLFDSDIGSLMKVERQVQIFGWSQRTLDITDGNILKGFKQHWLYQHRELRQGDEVSMIGTSVVKLTPLQQCRQILGIYFKHLIKGEGRKPMVRTWMQLPWETLRYLIDLAWWSEDRPIVKTVKSDELCAWDPRLESGNCNGDSGAPLAFFYNPNEKSKIRMRPMLMGITSGSLAATCDSTLPVVFTSVHYWHDWIQASVKCTLQVVHDTFDDPLLFHDYLSRTHEYFDFMINESMNVGWLKNAMFYQLARNGGHMITVKAFKAAENDLVNGHTNWCMKRDEIEEEMVANATASNNNNDRIQNITQSCDFGLDGYDVCSNVTRCFQASYDDTVSDQKQIGLLEVAMQQLLKIASQISPILNHQPSSKHRFPFPWFH